MIFDILAVWGIKAVTDDRRRPKIDQLRKAFRKGFGSVSRQSDDKIRVYDLEP